MNILASFEVDDARSKHVFQGLNGVKGPTSGIRAILENFALEDTSSIHKNLFSISMESLSPQVVYAAKLPILNPNEFDLWKMRIEQYFFMTNYSLWEVILNGDSPTPTRVIEGVLQPVAPTTAEQRLARKNELKARGTLLIALPDKRRLKFNTHKDVKTLMEAIKKRLQKLISQLEILEVSLSQEDINLNLKIYEAEVKSSSSLSTSTQNIAFMSSSNTDSTNEPVSAAASVYDVSAKIYVSPLPNVDSLSNQMAILIVRARRFLQRTGRNLRTNGPASMGFNMSKVECYNCHRKGHFARECSYNWSFQAKEEPTNYALMAFSSSSSSSDSEVVSCSKACTKAYATLLSHYDKLTEDYRKSQFDVISYQTGLEFVEARLLVYQQNEYVFKEDIKLLKLKVKLRNNALISLRQNLEKAEQERDALKLKLEKFQTSSKNLSGLLASQTNDKTGLGYNSQVFTRSMFDCDDYLSSGSDESLPPSPIYDRYQLGNGYHVVPLPYKGTFMPPKHNLVFNNSTDDVKTGHFTFTVKLSPTKPDQDLSHTHRPSAPIIKDWVSDSEDESETKPPQNVPNFVQSIKQVKSPRPSIQHVDTSIPTANSKTTNPKPTRVLTQSNLVPITAVRPVTTVVPKTNVTIPRHAKTVVTKPSSPPRRHIHHSPSHKASTFPPKVTAIKAPMVNAAKGVQGKWEWKAKCPILNHGNPQRTLNDKGVIDSGCSRHMTGNMSYLSAFEEFNGGYVAFGGNPKGVKISRKGKFNRKVNAGFLVGYSVSSKAFRVFNSRNQIIQETLHVNFREHKPNVVGSGPTWLFDIDTLTKTMNYQPVTTGNQSNPSAGNTDEDAAFDEKEPEFEGRKPNFEVNVSLSSSAQSKKHDDKTKREAKGKSPVESLTGYRNLSAEFVDFSDNSINKNNANGTLVPAIGQLSPNSTNTFSVAGPLNAAVTPQPVRVEVLQI
nr:hypothetical protein [Tanacetum cinerariifolium]